MKLYVYIKVIISNMTSEKTYYQKDWLQHPDHKDWIAPDTHAKTKALSLQKMSCTI